MVFFSSRISPFTSTVILRLKSPRATAVVTSAILRTCAVRLLPIALTESVKSFQVPATPGTTACTPRRPSVPTSRATRVTSDANERSCSTIVLIVSLSCRISPRTSTVIFFDKSPFATAISRFAAAVTSSTATSNAASLAFDGRVAPLSLRTNWRADARISSSVAGGSKLASVLILRHMAVESGGS